MISCLVLRRAHSATMGSALAYFTEAVPIYMMSCKIANEISRGVPAEVDNFTTKTGIYKPFGLT